MTGVKIVIIRFTDPTNPGWVECNLTDAFGKDWKFIEKVPVVSSEYIDATAQCPRPAVIACEIIQRRQESDGRTILTISTEKPWGVSSTTGKSGFDVLPRQLTVLPSPHLWDAFREDTQFVWGTRPIKMTCREIGAINLPTGQIVACDPFSQIHTRHFSQRVEPDSYDVFLAIADSGQDQRVAAAMILFEHDVVPTRWEHAKEVDSGPQSSDGYDVDSGRGCFLDLKLARLLIRKAKAGTLERFLRKVMAEFVEHDRPTWSWANVILDEANGTNIVAFSTGVGDGSYSSFFGFSSDDRLVCLTTDFGLLDIFSRPATHQK